MNKVCYNFTKVGAFIMPINSANRDYEILTDGDLANILYYFQPEYVIDAVNGNLNNIFRPFNMNMSNIVSSYEINFNARLEQYPGAAEEINKARTEAYNTIIKTICNYFNIMINTESSSDIYTVAYYLYEFFISNFTHNLILFFSSFMMNEKDNLVNYFISNGQIKKSNTSAYIKKLVMDQNLGLLLYNTGTILSGLVSQDISINDIIDFVYGKNTDTAILLNNTVLDRGDFYKSFFCKYIIDQNTFPTLVTMIRLDIQQKSDIVKININKNDMEDEK